MNFYILVESESIQNTSNPLIEITHFFVLKGISINNFSVEIIT